MNFTDELLEICAEAVHKAYCDYHIKNKGKEYWTKGDYSLLDEPTKQIDRETVNAVFAAIKANRLEAEVDVTLADKREIKLQEHKIEIAKIWGFNDIIYYAQKRIDDLNAKLSKRSD